MEIARPALEEFLNCFDFLWLSWDYWRLYCDLLYYELLTDFIDDLLDLADLVSALGETCSWKGLTLGGSPFLLQMWRLASLLKFWSDCFGDAGTDLGTCYLLSIVSSIFISISRKLDLFCWISECLLILSKELDLS